MVVVLGHGRRIAQAGVQPYCHRDQPNYEGKRLMRVDQVKHRAREREHWKRSYAARSGPLFAFVYFLESESEKYRTTERKGEPASQF
jgi:hypothetical protein